VLTAGIESPLETGARHPDFRRDRAAVVAPRRLMAGGWALRLPMSLPENLG
jgi:hypothetical protein